MTQDYEICRGVWESKIPVEIVLESDEVLEQPKPFYAMLPRVSYFPLILPKVINYFTSTCEELRLEQDKLWLEYSRQPIKMYYPIGVLFDMMKTDDFLPWTISLRTKDAPSNGANIGKEALESMFMQSLKEADYLRRKADVITSMKSEDHKQLWRGLAHDNFDEFWSVNKKLVDSSEKVAYLPIRLYKTGSPMSQIPLSPWKSPSSPNLLSDALTSLESSLDLSTHSIISHGIEVPLDTPLSWLAQNVSYPDNFVHLVAVPTK
ncbi:atg-5 [Pristionchus pacificus]|nr:atg-5 [Pristionchus pacificus]